MASAAKTTSQNIYGVSLVPKPCKYTVKPALDINTYLRQLNSTLIALKNFNNKTAAIENITIIQSNITNAIAEESGGV